MISLRSVVLLATLLSIGDDAKWRFASAFSSPFLLSSSQRTLSTMSSFSFTERSSVRKNFLKNSKAAARSTTGARNVQLSMAIDRMSNDCVAAIQKAHEIGNSMGMKSLKNEIIFVGMVANPERAAKTLQRYRLNDYDEIEISAIKTLQFKSEELNPDPGFNGDNQNAPLPFSDESRVLLAKACAIADRLESPTVRSEHVILALMGYNNGMKIETVPVMDLLRTIPSLKQVNTETGGFTVTQFCQDLVNALPMTPVSDSEDDLVVKDTVVVGGSARAGGATATLDEVGVDMTQMALDGKLDMVFGRETEIRSALRTLGRRRKNNPCLIGDPGVGKVRPVDLRSIHSFK